MRKKVLMLITCGCLLAGSAHAQWVVTDPTNLAQSIINTTKEIVQTSKTVKNTLDNFKEVEKLYNESKKYYDALKKVNDLVRDAQKVKETILMVGEISDIYVNNYKKMLSDPNFRPEELVAIANGYTKLLGESNNLLKELKQVYGILDSDLHRRLFCHLPLCADTADAGALCDSGVWSGMLSGIDSVVVAVVLFQNYSGGEFGRIFWHL